MIWTCHGMANGLVLGVGAGACWLEPGPAYRRLPINRYLRGPCVISWQTALPLLKQHH